MPNDTPYRTVHVFMSSTFADMQAERDHLVRVVFPTLRHELLAHRIHLVDVDLRWGVTGDEDVVDVCRQVIDDCRPWFVCLLGSRYGSVLKGRNRSITHDEISYAVLDQPNSDMRAFFYFRDPAATEAIIETSPGEYREPQGSRSADQLDGLKMSIKKAGYAATVYSAEWNYELRRFTGLREFGDRIQKDLLSSILKELGPREDLEVDEFSDERAANAIFMEERQSQFVLGSRKEILKLLLDHAFSSNAENYQILTGRPGYGKSALLARTCRDLIEAFSKMPIEKAPIFVPVFIGAGGGNTDSRLVLRYLCHELKRLAGLESDVPEHYADLGKELYEIIHKASSRRRIVIVLDGVDQLHDSTGFPQVSWLPERIPANVRVILSSLPEDTLAEWTDRHQCQAPLNLEELTRNDTEAIVASFLERYQKKMNDDQRQALLTKAGTSTPLYLTAALEELRTLGTYEEITARIVGLPQTSRALFKWILKRVEDDPGIVDASGQPIGRVLVRDVAVLLATSRLGLSLCELEDLVASYDPQGNVAVILRHLRPFLVQRGELVDFFHAEIRNAIFDYYLGSSAAQQDVHRVLSGYFERQADPGRDRQWRGTRKRAFVEYPWHLGESDGDALLELCIDACWLDAKVRHDLVVSIIYDCDMAARTVRAPQRSTALCLKDCLLLAAAVVSDDPNQLVSQFHGRLGNTGDFCISSLLGRMTQIAPTSWLRSTNSNLVSPGGGSRLLLAAHAEFVTEVAIDGAASLAVSSSKDKTLIVWDLASGRALQVLSGHRGPVETVAMSRNGDLVISGARDLTIKLWNTRHGYELLTLEGHEARIDAVAISARGDVAASVSEREGRLRVWDLIQGRQLHLLECSRPQRVVLSADGKLAIVAGAKGRVRLFDLSRSGGTRRLPSVPMSHESSLVSLVLSSDGTIVAAGTGKTVVVSEVATGYQLQQLEYATGEVCRLFFSEDDQLLMSATTDRDITVSRWATGTIEEQWPAGDWRAEAAWLVDDCWRVLSKQGSCIRVNEQGPLSDHMDLDRFGGASSVSISADGRIALSSGGMSGVLVWNAESGCVTGRLLEARTGASPVEVSPVAISADGGKAAAVFINGQVRVWNPPTGELLWKHETSVDKYAGLEPFNTGPFVIKTGELSSVALAADGRIAAVGSRDRIVLICDLERQEVMQTLAGYTYPLEDVAINGDGSVVLAASGNRLLVWRAGDETLHELPVHDTRVRSVAMTRDGRIGLSCAGGKIHVWLLATAERVGLLTGHRRNVNDIAISQGGELCVSAGADRTLRVWDLHREASLATFTGDSEMICCSCSADGRSIVAGEISGRIHFLSLITAPGSIN